MKVLVTGGAGFIGSHLSAHLLRKNLQISIADHLHPYYPASRKKEQLQTVRETGDFVFFEEDLVSEEACERIFKNPKYDTVIHLAALPGVAPSLKDPLLYIDMNIKATANVLKYAGENGVNHVIFASSSSVYGERNNVMLAEEMADGKVISPYAATKVSGESFCHLYRQLYGFQLTILRFFTAYGPWGRPDLAIPKFIQKLLRGEEIEIYGMDTARDYTYIDDLVAGIEAALNHPRCEGVYNLGSGQPVLMSMLLQELIKHFPTMKTCVKPRRAGDVKSTWADIGKAASVLGYSTKTSFSEGLARTVAWEKERFLRA